MIKYDTLVTTFCWDKIPDAVLFKLRLKFYKKFAIIFFIKIILKNNPYICNHYYASHELLQFFISYQKVQQKCIKNQILIDKRSVYVQKINLHIIFESSKKKNSEQILWKFLKLNIILLFSNEINCLRLFDSTQTLFTSHKKNRVNNVTPQNDKRFN